MSMLGKGGRALLLSLQLCVLRSAISYHHDHAIHYGNEVEAATPSPFVLQNVLLSPALMCVLVQILYKYV